MIPSDLFQVYESALHGNIDLMQRSFAQLMSEVETIEPMAARQYIRQAYQALVAEYGGYASVAALEFYEQVRESAQLKTRYDATTFIPNNAALLEYDVDAAVSMCPEIQKLINRLFSTGTERVMQYADETITRNAAYDPANPKWALVPHATACGWCRMIASNGFYISTKEKVENTRHPNCKCTPVVDFDTKNPKLDGYDPAALYDEYKKAKDAIKETTQQEWEDMSKEERDRYKKKNRGAYDHFLRNKTASEMNKQTTKKSPLRLKKSEYARVNTAINDVYHARYDGKSSGYIAVGNYSYRFKINEFGDYIFISKDEIE